MVADKVKRVKLVFEEAKWVNVLKFISRLRPNTFLDIENRDIRIAGYLSDLKPSDPFELLQSFNLITKLSYGFNNLERG